MWEETNKKKDEEVKSDTEKQFNSNQVEENQKKEQEETQDLDQTQQQNGETTESPTHKEEQTQIPFEAVDELTPLKPKVELPSYLIGIQKEESPEKKQVETSAKTTTQSVTFPPGFVPRTTIGPIEGHPQEGFGEKEKTNLKQPDESERVQGLSSTETTEEIIATSDKTEFVQTSVSLQSNLALTEKEETLSVTDLPTSSAETEKTELKGDNAEKIEDLEKEPELEKTPQKALPNIPFRSDKSGEISDSLKTEATQTTKTTAIKVGQQKLEIAEKGQKITKTEKSETTPKTRQREPIPSTTTSARTETSRVGTQKGTTETTKSDVIRNTLSGNLGDKGKSGQQPFTKTQAKKETRQERQRDEKRETKTNEDISLETLKRRVSELTPKERKVLNELLSNKRISRNLNEILEKDTLGAEKTVQNFGKVSVMMIWGVLLIGLLFYGFLWDETNVKKWALWIAGVMGVVWLMILTAGLRALIIREVTKAKFDYEEKLKLELNVRSIVERLNSDIAPRIPEMMAAIKRILEKIFAK